MLGIDKFSYSIGQVSSITEITQSTLRYWETVIEIFNPIKTKGGSRRYSKKDIELILQIKGLLYEQGLTIKGTNFHFNKHAGEVAHVKRSTVEKSEPQINAGENIKETEYILGELLRIKNILE